MPDSLYIAHQDFTFNPVLNEVLGWSLFSFIISIIIFIIVICVFIFKS